MAVVTFMSDFGTSDHYVAAVKASILKYDPSANIVDISHDINSFDIGHAAYVLKQVFRDFPEGSVHLVSVDTVGRKSDKYVAAKLDNHFFVCPDNGLLSLISQNRPEKVVDINSVAQISSTFPAKDILAKASAELISKSLDSLGPEVGQYIELIGRQVKATKKEIVGNVIRVDHFGNLITNIEQQEFETIHRINKESGYQIRAGREQFNSINTAFYQVDPGECYLLFNSQGLLQIGINKGNASELLGIQLDSPIFITFNQ